MPELKIFWVKFYGPPAGSNESRVLLFVLCCAGRDFCAMFSHSTPESQYVAHIIKVCIESATVVCFPFDDFRVCGSILSLASNTIRFAYNKWGNAQKYFEIVQMTSFADIMYSAR